MYRIGAGAAPEPVEREVDARDELAFGYVNPEAKRWLLVYGVDEHGHVYWFHPSWEDPAENPRAIPAQPGAQVHELPEAISHALDGRALTLYGALSDERLSVKQVEQLLREHRPLPGAQTSALELEVTR
ncbi:hypothetical protein FGE12_12200 [Aggregicoccus sp. 17bor-14]|uniref:hypothetical protein n=1 Tax=Myxococcaceae TaxID=31 RepID=UPI00129C8F04|nr:MULTISPECIES: hypothetical protein [Myxococcaceae]MBF5043151.1 hypothetical protein [Simulacricoccus sp. 17bor-14]MRI88910.1 hypothetical protein [Aggregicoccus sp. 17bor-14]